MWNSNSILDSLRKLNDIKVIVKKNIFIVDYSNSDVSLIEINHLIKVISDYNIVDKVILSNSEEERKLELARYLKIPIKNFKTFLNWIGIWFTHIRSKELPDSVKTISTLILQPLCNQIRIVSQLENPFRLFIKDFIQYKPKTTFPELNQEIEQIQGLEIISIPISTVLHTLKHSSKAKERFYEMLDELNTINNKLNEDLSFIVETKLNMIEDDPGQILIITMLNNSEKIIEKEIEVYWLTLGSLILRNVSAGIIRLFFQKQTKKTTIHSYFEQSDVLKDKIQDLSKKQQKFVESCMSPDLTDAYKSFKDQLTFNAVSFLRVPELIQYNRTSILADRAKSAREEYFRNPTNKTLKKRSRTRENRYKELLARNIEKNLEFFQNPWNLTNIVSVKEIIQYELNK